MECKCIASYYNQILKQDIGSVGRFANWRSCGIVFHQASGVSWTTYLKAWTKHMNVS